MGLSYPLLLSPLLGAAINLLVIPARFQRLIGALAVLAVFLPFVLSFGFYAGPLPYEVIWFHWLQSANIDFVLGFKFDALSLWMVHLVSGIGTLIHIYSLGYMREEEGFKRYFVFLNLFIFFMLLLVTSANLLFCFFGWEGVGLCSYFLIGHYHRKESARRAANKAFIMNRVGDLGFILGMFSLYKLSGSIDFDSLNAILPPAVAAGQVSVGWLTLALLLVFWSCTGKSAQFPLFTWLPDAMEGPTPVSALIHAATMVTAGVYLVARLAPTYAAAPLAGEVIVYIGAGTALIAALIATQQWDIKKILAYSTISQLGFMFTGLGLGAGVASIFHLSTHAFFKALLFLASGAVIYALHHEQDITNMGGLRKKLHTIYLTFSVGAWCLAGLPLGSGFFSKDGILLQAYSLNPLAFAFLAISSLLTAYYIYRLIIITFIRPAEKKHGHHETAAVPWVMGGVLIVLAVGSFLISFADLPAWLMPAQAKAYLPLALASLPLANPEASLSAEWTVGVLAFILAVGGAIWAYNWFTSFPNKMHQGFTPASFSLMKLLQGKFFLDELYTQFVVTPYSALSEGVGQNILEPFFYDWPFLVKKAFVSFGRSINWIGESLQLRYYAFALAVAFLALVSFIKYYF